MITATLLKTDAITNGNLHRYGFAEQSLLASLEGIQFVTNLFFGRFVLGTTVTSRMYCGTVVVVVGIVVTILFCSKESAVVETDVSKS